MDGFVACVLKETVSPTVLSKTESILLNLKSAHHILLYHTHFHLEDCLDEEKQNVEFVDAESLYQHFKQHLATGDISISSLQDRKKGTFR